MLAAVLDAVETCSVLNSDVTTGGAIAPTPKLSENFRPKTPNVVLKIPHFGEIWGQSYCEHP